MYKDIWSQNNIQLTALTEPLEKTLEYTMAPCLRHMQGFAAQTTALYTALAALPGTLTHLRIPYTLRAER